MPRSRLRCVTASVAEGEFTDAIEANEVTRDPRVDSLSTRERYRDLYAEQRDPIADERLAWRAQTFRHLVHLLPGRTILQIGSGNLAFARALLRVSRGENHIVAATFAALGTTAPVETLPGVEQLRLDRLPGALQGRSFDYVVSIDLLDQRTAPWLLTNVHDLLAPGGQLVFYESNPWNVVLATRRRLSRLFRRRDDPRALMKRAQLYELLSEVGFIRVFSVYTDFVYAPLTRGLIWLLRNASIVLENAPVVRTLAGSILLHAQRPPRRLDQPAKSLSAHANLRHAVSVVIPCRNEEMNVRPLVDGLLAFYGDYIREILFLDDESTDATADAVAALSAQDARVRLIRRRPPHGVGYALKEGLARASGRWVLTMDCDFQHLLPELRDMFDAAAEDHPVIFGSRFSRSSVLLNYPFAKILSNRLFHVLAQLVLQRRFRDVTNNLKLMRRDVVEGLRVCQPGFAANAEIGLQPLLMGFPGVAVPISWVDRGFDMGASSFRLLRVGGGYLQVLLAVVQARWFGRGPYAGLRPGVPHPDIA